MNEYSEKNDALLVELTLLGDQYAFAELVGRYESSVTGTAYKITNNLYSAQDAAQDAFVCAWVKLDTLRESEKFGSWVCAIAKNCARSICTYYRNTIPDISLSLLENVVSEDSPTPDDELVKNEEEKRVHTAVDGLGTKIREIVSLHYFDGLSVKEIAERLSLPSGTVKWRLSEGRKQLRKEYGIMEKTYDEGERLTDRVMHQVEKLKLWGLKNDKRGFEEEYDRVLKAVEGLSDSEKKSHALADVLLRGSWWIPGKANDELTARIKENAEKSRNEEAMASVMTNEAEKKHGPERVEYIEKVQIPYLEELGFTKTLGYVYFWLGREKESEGYDTYIKCFRKAKELLSPDDVYYANAMAAIEVSERLRGKNDSRCAYTATGQVYRYIGNRLYFWNEPGFGGGGLYENSDSLFYNTSRCDRIIFDNDMSPGDSVISSDGRLKLTRKTDEATVTVPAGTFQGCSVWTLDGEEHQGFTYTETVFCEGVGIIKQTATYFGVTVEWVLDSYVVRGGDGLLPLADGNFWSYVHTNVEEGTIVKTENKFLITSFENGCAVTSHHMFTELLGYDEDSWHGNILKARREYVDRPTNTLISVEDALTRAKKLAKTPRQKRHTEIATDVMRRIFATEPKYNPDYTERGVWNFFDIYPVKVENGKTELLDLGLTYSFEWRTGGPTQVLHNFLYYILERGAGCIWSDEWVPGYHFVRNWNNWNLMMTTYIDVLDDEDVTTPAGKFKNCRHVLLNIQVKNPQNSGTSYQNGIKEYWFANGIGLVRMSAPIKEGSDERFSYELTKFRDTGTGFFPLADGMLRRYEVMIPDSGWHASVEYTYDKDESGFVIFRNALGTCDRKVYEGQANQK